MWKTDEVPKVYLTALCAWREARGCSRDAIRGVIHTIVNRASHPSWWGKSIEEVILKPLQYSSFNKNDPNSTKIPQPDDAQFLFILPLTDLILNSQDEDLTNGATHYHEQNMMPDWAINSNPIAMINPFKFYKLN